MDQAASIILRNLFSFIFSRWFVEHNHDWNEYYWNTRNKYRPHLPCIDVWQPGKTSLVDIKVMLGTVINMRLHLLADISDYFSNSWMNRTALFSDGFSRGEFLLLFWNLYFTHVEKTVDSSKYRFIKSITKAIKRKYILHYIIQPTVSTDESTISFKVDNPQKPTKFGIKACFIRQYQWIYLQLSAIYR